VSVRLLLDEMFSPEIASELVKRGHDVVAVAADPGLVGLPDEQVLEWATDQGRCLVTENVRDVEVLRRAAAAQGGTHAGVALLRPQAVPP
jgi:predicted nuclease of predicted toxin-antitoxin system